MEIEEIEIYKINTLQQFSIKMVYKYKAKIQQLTFTLK